MSFAGDAPRFWKDHVSLAVVSNYLALSAYLATPELCSSYALARVHYLSVVMLPVFALGR